jgi:DNA-binding transcriptional regulator GbsR (MarR family)
VKAETLAIAIKPVTAEKNKTTSHLDQVEVEVIDVCVRMAQFLGLPKSLGEIYGLLMVSPQPISMEAVIERLKISKGSASQGLKQLRAFGAVRMSYVAGDRRDHYVIEMDLARFLSGFLKERVESGVLDLAERLTRLHGLSQQTATEHKHVLQERVRRLQTWQTMIQKTLPSLERLLAQQA